MTANPTTLITFILDETGSMQSIKDDTIGGFNAFLEQMRRQEGDTRFTLIKFDSNRLAVVHRAVPINAVPDLSDESYQPGAATPLVDACMEGIQAAEQEAGAGDRVSIVIQTDGLENASTRFRNGDLAAKVKEKTNLGWMFTFLGAGIDAFAQAEQFGIDADHTLRYGRGRSRDAFQAAAGKNSRFMQAESAASFMPEEREAARDEEEGGRL